MMYENQLEKPVLLEKDDATIKDLKNLVPQETSLYIEIATMFEKLQEGIRLFKYYGFDKAIQTNAMWAEWDEILQYFPRNIQNKLNQWYDIYKVLADVEYTLEYDGMTQDEFMDIAIDIQNETINKYYPDWIK